MSKESLKAAQEIMRKWTVSKPNSDGYPKFDVSVIEIAKVIDKHTNKKTTA